MSILKTEHLIKQYGKEPNIVRALDDVSISVEPGEFVAIIGTSGSGKSTLLNMLGGLDRPTSGSVKVGKLELSNLSDDDLTVFRRRSIGFIFQNYNLVPILNVYENIVMPIQLDGKRPDEVFIEEVVSLLGIQKKLYQMPNTLSGGQQQRVSIARALAGKPAIILADEPTGNLDSRTSDEVIELLRVTSQQCQPTLVVLTH
ncbi:ABC transporter ATP-binding protein, partial [Schaedlerella sp.]|uniref:ABC transporter ATP-binding protein n=1 Tax=Schaedlerella sp. TaxID=2676057 RepID=UPI003745632D